MLRSFVSPSHFSAATDVKLEASQDPNKSIVKRDLKSAVINLTKTENTVIQSDLYAHKIQGQSEFRWLSSHSLHSSNMLKL